MDGRWCHAGSDGEATGSDCPGVLVLVEARPCEPGPIAEVAADVACCAAGCFVRGLYDVD